MLIPLLLLLETKQEMSERGKFLKLQMAYMADPQKKKNVGYTILSGL
jgi:hypothetical protein